MKIYIAEDDKIVRQGLKFLIGNLSADYEIVGEASNGRVALEQLRELETDLLITDIKMPSVDGIELIRQIKESNLKLKIIVLSGYNEFDYVRESLLGGANDYLLKPVEKDALSRILAVLEKEIAKEREDARFLESQKNVLRHLNLIKENYILQLIASHGVSFDRISPLLDDLRTLNVKHYLMIMGALDNTGEKGKIGEETLLAKECVEALFREEEKLLVIGNAIDDDKFVCLILSTGMAGSSLLQMTIVKLYRVVEQNRLAGVHLGLSRAYDDFSETGKAFQESLMSLQQMYYSEDRIICFTPAFALQNDKIEGANLPQQIEQLRNTMLTADYLKAKEMLLRMLEKLEEMRLTPERFKRQLVNILEQLGADANDSKDTGHLLEQTIRRIEASATYADTKVYLIEHFDSIVAGISYKTDKRRVIELCKDYIAQHYFEDLTLKTLADRVFLNPNYFSQLFKTYTGKNFIDYVTETRISIAKQLLTDPELKIYQIANMVGYQETVSFNRAFKKVSGVTPGDYRDYVISCS